MDNINNNNNNKKNKKIAILIAAYNEARHIKDVIRSCKNRYDLDIIIIDDGSTDETAVIIGSLKAEYKGIVLLKHEKNMGKGQALKTGFSYALRNNYRGVITIDADGQHNPDEIDGFIKILESEEPGIILGSRFHNTRGMPFIRLVTNIFTSWIISAIAGKKIDDVQSGFRYISRDVLENVILETANFDTEPEILLKASWAKFKILSVPITTIYHKNFVSHVNPLKDSVNFFKLVFKSIGWRRKFKKRR